METPTPVNLSAIQGILAKAKHVMKTVDAQKPIALSETTKKQIETEIQLDKELGHDKTIATAPGGYTREQVMASKFPQAVKEAMLRSIPPTPPARLEDMSDLDDVPMIPNRRATYITEEKKQVVLPTTNFTSNSDMITISKTELKAMINESLAQFFKQSYDKTLTEDAIKKTINLLISEGKISVKKKIG